MSTMYFIHSVNYHGQAANKKIEKLHQLINCLEDSIVSGPAPIQRIGDYLRTKCADLDKEYPRVKKPLVVWPYHNSRFVIASGTEGHSSCWAVSFSVTPVKQKFMFAFDGGLVVKQEGGEL